MPLFINIPCPHLPDIDTPLPITHTRIHRESCSISYHNACLELAQSLWCSGAPAQAILQLDKSFMADHSEATIPHHATYAAILWIILNAPTEQFLGNPVRHFQHLASRMNMAQPNAELRIWRAWACLHITEQHFPRRQFPRDEHQIEQEKLTIPTASKTVDQLLKRASQCEADAVNDLQNNPR